MKRLTAYKPTRDNWFPSYTMTSPNIGHLVEVTYFSLPVGSRVCVWGADDFGMEKDFPPEQSKESLDLFHDILSWEYVDISALRECGFDNA